MGRTPDRFPGASDEEGIVLSDDGIAPSQEGEMRYQGGAFQFQDSTGIFDPRAGGGGISEAQHKTLRQLIHFIDSGPAGGFATNAFHETLPSGNPFPTSYTWYTDATKVDKIVELTLTRNANKTPATEEWKMYDTDGSTVLLTVTDTISYSGVIETTRTRTIV